MWILDIFKNKEKNEKKQFFEKELNEWLIENQFRFRDEYRLYDLNCCPYCGVIEGKVIEASKKCSSCKEKIVLRTNKLNHQKLLLSETKAKEYDKFDEDRKEILFMEKQMNALSRMFPNYMYKFYDTKKQKPDLSARDYTFSFENWLVCEIDRDAYHKYQKYLKLNFQDRVIKCDEILREFQKASNVLRLQAKLVEYKKREDVLIESIVSLLYRDLTIAHLPYYHWKNRPFSEANFYADVETNAMQLLIDYMDNHNITINDIKKEFMEKAHPFIINVVSKEKAWPMIVDAYKHYLRLKSTNKY